MLLKHPGELRKLTILKVDQNHLLQLTITIGKYVSNLDSHVVDTAHLFQWIVRENSFF